MKKLMVFCLAAVLAVFLMSAADAKRATRDLVFEDDEEMPVASKEPGQTVIAVKAAIELERSGEKSTVLPDHEFKSGDKVKIVYTTNMDGYVYWLSQGTSGDYFMLYPTPKTGADNFVKKNDVHTIPAKGTFKFDDKAGVEKILLVLAANKIPELEAAAKEAALKDGKIASESSKVDKVQKETTSKRKTRDLVFEEEDDTASGISTSAQVNTNPADAFVVYYELKHK